MTEPITTRLLDVYRIGPGPSSSHTLGPMRAAAWIRARALEEDLVPHAVRVELLGSLAATGRGHGTDRAVLAGLLGWDPTTCDPDALLALPERLARDPRVPWGPGEVRLPPESVVFVPYRGEALPHPNTLVARLLDRDDEPLLEQTFCSVGGGFLQGPTGEAYDRTAAPGIPPPCPFHDGRSLLALAHEHGLGFGDLVLANEAAWEEVPGETGAALDRVWGEFRASIRRGLERRGELPGGLGLKRRAGDLHARVEAGRIEEGYADIALAQAYAFAVNEENAAGGRIVTAPTNGAAGIVPGVLVEAADRLHLDRRRIHRALATAGAVAMIIRKHASLSGAEVGCQGEVGSATSMAAAALCEILGGTPKQVEYAAEIGMEHNLGLTCDPLAGLVQAPCIERNAMGVAKAWSAAQLALHAEGAQVISLDRVVKVMKRTGQDMRREYKETSEGGLAVSLPEC